MKALLALVLLYCSPGAVRADDALYPALQLQSDCRPYEQATVMDNGNITVQSSLATAQRWGAFAIIQTLGHTAWPAGKHTILRTCLPPEGTRLELIKVFLGYIGRHPELGHHEGAFVAVKALQQAYPCSRNSG